MRDELLEKIGQTLDNSKVSVSDLEELEDVVTPGSGVGCNCK